MPKPVEGTSPYLRGLDGLRAIAVLAVIAYHLNFPWAKGGLLGVGVFFVLSGYLITDLLVAEYRRDSGIKLRQFWIRRARRLLPALFVMLFVVLGWVTLFDRGELTSMRSDLLPAIFYVSNWWFIFHHVSYFAKFGPPSPLGHLWSLAIEEQFYLIWPFFVLAGMKWIKKRWPIALVTLSLAAASAIEMALLYSPYANPTRIYEGTDTRAFALLIGASLAFLFPRNRKFAAVTPGARRVIDAVGATALAGIFVMFWATNEYEPFLYRGGMVLLSVLTALAIAVVVHPGARLGRVLGVEPLRWIGERSYGIYLWHYPVIVLTTPLNAAPNLVRAVLQVAASIVLAALSWKFVEQPVRHGALRRTWKRVRENGWSWPQWRPLGWAVGIAVVLNALVCTVGILGLLPVPAADATPHFKSIMPPTHRSHPATTPRTNSGTTTSTTTQPAGEGVTAIGDSVMVDAAPYLQQMLPGIVIDAQVGQQLYQVQNDVAQLKADGNIGDKLIVELGTNGPYSPEQLVTLLRSLGPMKRIVLVNTREPRPWEAQVNATIAQVAASYPNTTLVNWYAESATHLQDFYPDGVHLNPAGAQYYASLIVNALEAPTPRPHRRWWIP